MSHWSSLLVLVLLLMAIDLQHLANAMEIGRCEPAVDLFRLPRRVQPFNYKLNLELNPDSKAFSGAVFIDLRVQRHRDKPDFLCTRTISGKLPPFARDRNKIILNAEQLNIVKARFDQE